MTAMGWVHTGHSAVASPWVEEEDLSDMDRATELSVELVREHIFRRIHAELPYELNPIPVEARRFPDGGLLIRQVIFVRTRKVRSSPMWPAG